MANMRLYVGTDAQGGGSVSHYVLDADDAAAIMKKPLPLIVFPTDAKADILPWRNGTGVPVVGSVYGWTLMARCMDDNKFFLRDQGGELFPIGYDRFSQTVLFKSVAHHRIAAEQYRNARDAFKSSIQHVTAVEQRLLESDARRAVALLREISDDLGTDVDHMVKYWLSFFQSRLLLAKDKYAEACRLLKRNR